MVRNTTVFVGVALIYAAAIFFGLSEVSVPRIAEGDTQRAVALSFSLSAEPEENGVAAGGAPTQSNLAAQLSANAEAAATSDSASDEPTPVQPEPSEQPSRAASPPQGGTSEISSESLIANQIARCLPAAAKRKLDRATLALSVAANGSLNSTPVVMFAKPVPLPEDLQLADLIIQGALQCAPYRGTNPGGSPVKIAADFSNTASDTVRSGATSENPDH